MTGHPDSGAANLAMSGLEVTKLLTKLAGRQHAVLTRAQLTAAGLAPRRVDHLVANGRLLAIHPGVYAYGNPKLSTEGRFMAALMYVGAESGLTGAAGAHWLGLLRFPPAKVEVVTPGHVRSRRGLIVHRTGRPEFIVHRRMRVAAPERVLLQMAANGTSHQELRRLLSEAEFLRLTTIERVYRALGSGMRGAGALRAAAESHRPELALARGEGERTFIRLLESAHLPMPRINQRISRMTVDAVWPEHMLVVEIDDRDGHSTPAQRLRDARRDVHLRSLGYRVFRYTVSQLYTQPELIIGELSRELLDGRPPAA